VKTLVVAGGVLAIGILNISDSIVGLLSFLLVFCFIIIKFRYILNLLLFNRAIKASYLFMEWFSLSKTQINVNIQNINNLSALLLTIKAFTKQLNNFIENLSKSNSLEVNQNLTAINTVEAFGLILLKKKLINFNQKLLVLSSTKKLQKNIEKTTKNNKKNEVFSIIHKLLKKKRIVYNSKQLYTTEELLKLRFFANKQRMNFTLLTTRSKPHYLSKKVNNYLKKTRNKLRKFLLKKKSLLKITSARLIKKYIKYYFFIKNKKIIHLRKKLQIKLQKRTFPKILGLYNIIGPKSRLSTIKRIKFYKTRRLA